MDRMRAVCTGRATQVTEVRLTIRREEDDPGLTVSDVAECFGRAECLVAVPDKHMSNEELKLVDERVAAALGAEAPRVEWCQRKGGGSFAHDPYLSAEQVRVQRACYDACVGAMLPAPGAAGPPGGVAAATVTEDGHYIRFAAGVRLSVAERYAIRYKYRRKLPRAYRSVRVVLMDDDFDAEQHTALPADEFT